MNIKLTDPTTVLGTETLRKAIGCSKTELKIFDLIREHKGALDRDKKKSICKEIKISESSLLIFISRLEMNDVLVKESRDVFKIHSRIKIGNKGKTVNITVI